MTGDYLYRTVGSIDGRQVDTVETQTVQRTGSDGVRLEASDGSQSLELVSAVDDLRLTTLHVAGAGGAFERTFRADPLVIFQPADLKSVNTWS